MNPHCHILGLGCVAVDDILYVAAYPPPDAKAQVLRRERQCGGLTATALVAAARLGARCAYAGILGEDELSDFAVQALAREGVDLHRLTRRQQARPIHSTLVVDESAHTRNIFFDLNDVHGPDATVPDADVIVAARVLLVDMLGVAGMARAARIARAANIPVVADFESDDHPEFPDLLGLPDHLIVSQEFAARLTGKTEPAAAAEMLWSNQRRVVAVTCGAGGCWYLADILARKPCHQPAFRVATVDTTGCGDVFHGAYAAGLVQGLDVAERIRFAAAAAALKATQRGGQAGCPTREQVASFLEGQH
jgi:sugar/nucleoside kinase (ribokinase family)